MKQVEIFNATEIEASVLLYKACLEYYININDFGITSINTKLDEDASAMFNAATKTKVSELRDLGFIKSLTILRESVALRCELYGEENRTNLKHYVSLLQWRWHSIFMLSDIKQIYEDGQKPYIRVRKFKEPQAAYNSLTAEFSDNVMMQVANDLYNVELTVHTIANRLLVNLANVQLKWKGFGLAVPRHDKADVNMFIGGWK